MESSHLDPTLINYKFTKRVYYVKSQQDDTVILAIDPKFQEGYLVWFDTIKERMKPITNIIKANEEQFSFDSEGVIYSFYPLTIELYEKYVKEHLIAPAAYLDLADLESKILSTIETAW